MTFFYRFPVPPDPAPDKARFLSLFENAIKNHGGCVGGAIFVDGESGWSVPTELWAAWERGFAGWLHHGCWVLLRVELSRVPFWACMRRSEADTVEAKEDTGSAYERL